MEQYRDRVRQARASQSQEVIYNSSRAHAAVLIEELFNAAENRIAILTEELGADVYGLPSVMNAAQAFLERPGAKLHLIVEQPIASDHPFMAATAGDQRYAAHVSTGTLPMGISAPKFNFMVADGTSYRYERDKRFPSAMACFNGRNVGQRMLELVDRWVDLGLPPVAVAP